MSAYICIQLFSNSFRLLGSKNGYFDLFTKHHTQTLNFEFQNEQNQSHHVCRLDLSHPVYCHTRYISYFISFLIANWRYITSVLLAKNNIYTGDKCLNILCRYEIGGACITIFLVQLLVKKCFMFYTIYFPIDGFSITIKIKCTSTDIPNNKYPITVIQ